MGFVIGSPVGSLIATVASTFPFTKYGGTPSVAVFYIARSLSVLAGLPTSASSSSFMFVTSDSSLRVLSIGGGARKLFGEGPEVLTTFLYGSPAMVFPT